ncbi:hypothetical protein GETHLI_29300 [Geothrix limicola]|uniref:Uncharacterized protein n=1 Tax=Geothrix limicola TaxID=2927978 RepID=A0ABQ5QJC7_9BACT|nr:hypothetical protein [Geothrix limicola]GLH74428.1 hypothetical protein GETHLI_29300 [Geothrix limicola]
MMDPAALRLAADLGGTLLSGAGGGLLLVERLQAHGLPQVAVLGRDAADLREPLEAAARAQAGGLQLNLLALLPLPDCDLRAALETHRRRLGALVAALDAGLPWLGDAPMLALRLPGRITCEVPAPLAKAPMGPLEKAELKAFLPDWEKGRRKQVFRQPEWRPVPEGFETDLWPGVSLPEGAQLRVPPLELPFATPLTDALRAALRMATEAPVPFLPLPGDPAPLHALRTLTPEIAVFRGPLHAWELALANLSRLPGPPHFCARC